MPARRPAFRLIPAALAAFAAMAAATSAAAQDTRPTVAVLYFDNNSIGRDAADYGGIGKGIADLLITDLAATSGVRVVERERVQTLLQEQDLVRQGAIDPATAVRLGKLLGVRHMITGGFMSTGSQMVLTARTIDVESGQISNPQRVQQAGDDVLGLVGQLSGQLKASLKLPPVERRTGDAGHQEEAGHQHQAGHQHAAGHQHDPAHHAAPQGAATPAAPSATAAKPAKLDLRTALLYSRALEAQDAGDRARAVELYDQVLSRYPDLQSARTNRDKLASSED